MGLLNGSGASNYYLAISLSPIQERSAQCRLDKQVLCLFIGTMLSYVGIIVEGVQLIFPPPKKLESYPILKLFIRAQEIFLFVGQ